MTRNVQDSNNVRHKTVQMEARQKETQDFLTFLFFLYDDVHGLFSVRMTRYAHEPKQCRLASPLLKGLDTEHTTVKWSIIHRFYSFASLFVFYLKKKIT